MDVPPPASLFLGKSSMHASSIAALAGLLLAAPLINGAAQPASPERPRVVKNDPGHDAPIPAVAFPHPMISEVLFAVPTGNDGDANKDGKRQVSGDEFVELVNPHDRAIELRGYTLTDGSANVKTQLRFTFPAMILPAHAAVVVFNGHDSKIPGPVGDAKGAPVAVNENFHKAAVFSMHVLSSRVSFSNAGDAACLKAPDGKPVQRVRWGKADEKAGGSGFALDEVAPVTSKGSVQRDGVGKDGAWKVHTEIDAAPFSPGQFGPTRSPSNPPAPTSPPAATPVQPSAPSPPLTPAPREKSTDPVDGKKP
jgi:hypothetical protein